jgi:putative transport protein
MIASRFIENVLPPDSVTSGLATLSLAVAIGIALGNIRIFGVRLGIAAVLFSALFFAQLRLTIDPRVLDYFRDFALVLFVYTIGLQLGPGFVASLRAEGVRLNVLAVAVVVLGAVFTAGIVVMAHLPRDRAAGLYTGGFATTPALAAGQEALRQIIESHGGDARKAVANTNLAYSVAYPFGLTGPILLVVLFRLLFRIDMKDELRKLTESEQVRRPPLAVADVEVSNPALAEISLRDRRFHHDHGVLFTRLFRDGVQQVPSATTTLKLGDVVRAIGPQRDLDELIQMMGKRGEIKPGDSGNQIERMELLVTCAHVLGKSLRELNLTNRHGVTLARIHRAGADLPATAVTKLHFGDNVVAVGPAEGLKAVETELGNSTEAMNYTQLIPIFLGIWLGVIVGSIPLAIPGLNTSIRIGLAGGPMLVAIVLSRLGNIGSIVWYMPPAANQVLRDFGMALFLACVGFQSGDRFVQKLLFEGGLPLVGWGAIVTIVPMFLVGLFGRLVWKMNFITLSGLISGAMTSSPTLLFANEITESTSPAVAYAAVYPLAMLIPVFCAQVLVTVLSSTS